MKSPILGSAYVSRSPNQALERMINLYLEIIETKQGASPGALFGAPGLDLVASIGPGPIRGMVALEDFLYVVSGNEVWTCNTSFNLSQIGTLLSGDSLLSIIDNGVQIAMFDGINGYSVVGGVVSLIDLPFSNPGTAVYQDGFGVVNQVGTETLWQSNLNDLTTWDPLNFDTEDGITTNIVGLGELNRQIYVLKEHGAFPWVNAGNAGFVFQRLDGVQLDAGCIAPASIHTVFNTLLWLGQDSAGQGIVFQATGYEPVRVSTHAIEYEIAQYPTISDAQAFGYQQEGHYFYGLNFPSGNATWVLDLTASRAAGHPIWHQRAAFSQGQFNRYALSCCVFFNGMVLGGDHANGNLYALNLNSYTDNGSPRKWLRSWRAMPQPEIPARRINWLEIECETGVNVGVDNPQMVLRYTDDAHSWSPERFVSVGAEGQTAQRVKFNRLGMVRRGANSDRVFELSSTDPFKVALLSADIG